MKEIKLFALLMQVVFITLKLCSVIGWSWWIILSPILVFVLWKGFIYGLAFCAVICKEKQERKEWAKYGAKNALDCRIKKMEQMQKEQMEKIRKQCEERNG